MLTLQTLGAPRFDGPEGELLRGRRKELALLAYLARRAPRPVGREALADLLWGTRPDANARQSLRQALLSLRRVVPALDTETDAVALDPAALELDLARFEADLAAGRRAEALARWQGDFLAGYDDVGGEAFRTWVEGERAGLRRRLQVALAELVDEAERAGDTAEMLRWAERWTELFPLDEDPVLRLARLLQRAGRTGDAASRLATFASRLRHDLGTEPSSEFARLREELVPETRAARPTPASGALFTPALAGRNTALQTLGNAWTLATSGTATLVLVEGDEGIGKTRLCEEFQRTLPAATVVLRARGTEAAHAIPLSVVRELLGTLHEAPGLAGARGSALAAVGAVAAGVRERFPDAAQAGSALELPEALTEVLTAVAAEVPVLLYVDDFPLADRESRSVMLAVARRLRHAAVCILVTSRSVDTPADLLAELRGRVGETRVRLTALSEDEVETLLTSMLEIAPEDRAALVHRLHAESGGNPFFLIETLASLLDEGRLVADARGVWRPAAGRIDGALPVAPSVREAARRRYEALSADARAVADAAGVLGPLATRARLAAVVRLSDDTAESAIEELVLRRVLRPMPADPQALEFVHDVTRRVVLDHLPGVRRRSLHGAAWRTLRAEPASPAVTPVVLAHHRRHAGPFGGRLPPWVGTRTLALAAAVVLVVVAAWLRFAPSASGFAERDWIVLADLDNATGDSIFDESLTAALYVAISQSQYVNVFPPARVQETLQRMQRGDAPRLTEPLAREVAQRDGIRAVVTLALTRSDNRYTLTSRIVDPASGSSLATLSTEAQGRDGVIGALDALADGLRKRLGESTRDVRERSVPLPQATTPSLDALKAFADGMRAMDEGRTADAITALEAAIALDSGFAAAHAQLGRYIEWTNIPENPEPHLERALALADRLPPRERLNVEWTVARGRGDRATAVRLAREYLRQYPDDRDAWFALARSLQEAGDLEGALEAYQRELEIDPNASGAIENSALLYSLTGRPREAVAAFERGMALDSSIVTRIAGDRNRLYGFALLSLGDTNGARATFTRLLSGNPAQRANGFRSLGLLETYLGRYRQAADWLRQAVQLNEQGGSAVSELRNRLHLAGVYRTAGREADARAQLRRALAIQQSQPEMGLTWLGLLVPQLARSGMLAEADRVLAVMENHRQLRDARDSVWLALARGETALARGDAATAAGFLASAPEYPNGRYLGQGLARALVSARRFDDAVGAYQAMLRDSALGDEAQEPWVLAHYELASLYDLLGDSVAALPLYRRLAEQWRNGDPDLPVFEAIRRRLGAGD